MRIDILSLFPGYFKGPFDESILKRAQEKGVIKINLIDIRAFTEDKHHKVDDRPYGGGPGMVMMPQPIAKAIASCKSPGTRVVYLSPQGSKLTAEKCRELAGYEQLIFVCGHYEGIDERVIESDIDEEISIGDYVLTNGCLAAIVVLDAMVRFIPGVLGHEAAASEDSFEEGLLDCPHYTRPAVWQKQTVDGIEERSVPDVLMSGNHEQIAEWRKQAAIKKTRRVRPDILK